jgi:serine/threonine-protein kinase HipA
MPSLQQAIEQARFSDVKPIVSPPTEKIGRSPLLGRRQWLLWEQE